MEKPEFSLNIKQILTFTPFFCGGKCGNDAIAKVYTFDIDANII